MVFALSRQSVNMPASTPPNLATGVSIRERLSHSVSRRGGRARIRPDDAKQPFTSEMVRNGLMDLGKTADGTSQAYLTFKLNNTTAEDVSMLKDRKHLQKLEISKNMICDLRHLSGMENLVYINVSDNRLTQLLDIPEPRPCNLRGVDFRTNRISGFKDVAHQLQAFSSLRDLALDNNIIESAVGLASLSNLLHVSITSNRLRHCHGFDALTAHCLLHSTSIMQSLVHIDISNNRISSIQPLRKLTRLRVLVAARNRIITLDGVSGCKSLNRLDVSDNSIEALDGVADAAACPLLGNLNLSCNPAQSCIDYRLHLVSLLPQVNNLDNLLVDEKEKVHAQNLHGADAEGLKQIRDRYFPNGELDDGGGAIPPIAAGLLADDGTAAIPESSGPGDFTRIDGFVQSLPVSVVAEGVLVFADFLQDRMKTHLELARAVYQWIVRNAVFPRDGKWGQSVSAPLFPQFADLEEALLYGVTGTWSERVATLFVSMAKACHLEAVTVSGYWRHDGVLPGCALRSHNHCWNAVKVNGLWRLVDCANGARLCGHAAFFTLPEHFRFAYQPLNAPWSLLRDYISNDVFFAQLWARTCFFNLGCRVLFPADMQAVQHLPAPMQGTPLPAPVLRVAVAPSYRLEHRLLDPSGKCLYPLQRETWERHDNEWDFRPGAPIFQDVVVGECGAHYIDTPQGALCCQEHRVAVTLPAPGSYIHELFIVRDLPGAIRCNLAEDEAPLELTVQEKFLALRTKVCCHLLVRKTGTDHRLPVEAGTPGNLHTRTRDPKVVMEATCALHVVNLQAHVPAQRCRVVQYVLPPAVVNTRQGCPVVCDDTPQSVLPAATPVWWRVGAQLLTPEPEDQLEADRTTMFALRVPGAHELALLPRRQACSPGSGAARGCLGRDVACMQETIDPSDVRGATEVPWDPQEQAFRVQLVVPRADMLDVVARMDSSAPWQQLLRFQLLPEGQHLRERPDLVFEPPLPDKRDPTFSLVRDIMKNVDTDRDGLISRKEYLTKIRKDRKYADFLKMPPRITQGDGTLEKFVETFEAINCSRNGRFSTNELALYLGCAPMIGSLCEEASKQSVASGLGVPHAGGLTGGLVDRPQLPGNPLPGNSIPSHASKVHFLSTQGSRAGSS